MVSRQGIGSANVSRRAILTSLSAISILGISGCFRQSEGEIFVRGNNSSNKIHIEMVEEDEATIHNDTYEIEPNDDMHTGTFRGEPQTVFLTINEQETKKVPYKGDCSNGFLSVNLHNDSTMNIETTCEKPDLSGNSNTSE